MPRYERHTARIEGDFVVFILGMRIYQWWNPKTMRLAMSAMPSMIKELEAHPESGFLGAEFWLGRTTLVLQYWRSMDHLMAYAHAKDSAHWPAWVRFNQTAAKDSSAGIFHETYLVRAGEYECVYGNMPLMGLAKAAQRVEAVGELETASGRLGRRG